MPRQLLVRKREKGEREREREGRERKEGEEIDRKEGEREKWEKEGEKRERRRRQRARARARKKKRKQSTSLKLSPQTNRSFVYPFLSLITGVLAARSRRSPRRSNAPPGRRRWARKAQAPSRIVSSPRALIWIPLGKSKRAKGTTGALEGLTTRLLGRRPAVRATPRSERRARRTPVLVKRSTRGEFCFSSFVCPFFRSFALVSLSPLAALSLFFPFLAFSVFTGGE